MSETIRLALVFTCVSVLVLIVANVELFINKYISVYEGNLVKDVKMISAEKTGLNDPIWIYNSKRVHLKDIRFPFKYHKSDFVKEHIEEHLGSKINRPFLEVIENTKNIFKSSMPVNNLYKILSKGEEAIYTVDPGMGIETTNYKLIHSKRDNNIEAFISGNSFYILKH